jgi:hypothetical protein
MLDSWQDVIKKGGFVGSIQECDGLTRPTCDTKLDRLKDNTNDKDE